MMRLAVFLSHPIQYKVPLMCLLAKSEGIELSVFFYSDTGIVARKNPTHGLAVQWDRLLLEGYAYEFLPNWMPEGRWRLKGLAPHFNPLALQRVLRGRFDVVMVHSYFDLSDWLVWLAAKVSKTKVLFCGDLYPKSSRSRLQKLANVTLARWMVRSASACLAIGSVALHVYRQEFQIPPERIFLAPYAVDNDYFISKAAELASSRNAIRTEMGIKEGEVVVLCVAGMVAKKRHTDLIDALANLQNTRARLLLVGAGPLFEQVRAYAQHCLPETILTGFINQSKLPQFYASADIFVLPSQWDEFGLVVNEAMCFGLPVIASLGVAAAQDLVVPGENGFVFPPRDVATLARALSCLIDDSEKRRSFGARSRQVISQWGYEQTIQGIWQAILTSK